MNLYKSFGNLMEAWVTEGAQCSDSDCIGYNDEDCLTPSSDMGTNPFSESVDSGVETASSDLSFPATFCSVSTDNAEIDVFTPEKEGDGLTPASTSQSPVFSSPVPSLSSSSSSCLCPSRAQESSTTLCQKVEQTLQRADSNHQKKKPVPITVDEVLRRRPGTSFSPKRHTSEVVRGQRSNSFGLRKTSNSSVNQMCIRPMSMSCDRQPAQARSECLGEEEGKGLSPGLSYLEEVCQMLEEIAKQQMHRRVLQVERDALRERQDTEASQSLDTCQSDFKAAEEDRSFCQGPENTESAEDSSSGPQRQKDHPQRRLLQRSASDTTIATLHLNCRGQHLSTDDLLEEIEEHHEVQEDKKAETNKTKKNWKLKFGSLRREASAVRDTNGQQMQKSEESSTRRKLSKLFRRNRRTTLTL